MLVRVADEVSNLDDRGDVLRVALKLDLNLFVRRLITVPVNDLAANVDFVKGVVKPARLFLTRDMSNHHAVDLGNECEGIERVLRIVRDGNLNTVTRRESRGFGGEFNTSDEEGLTEYFHF